MNMEEMIKSMTRDELENLCLQLASSHPEIVYEMLKSRDDIPRWCVCYHCREMPTDREKQCCGEKRCVTLDQNFEQRVFKQELSGNKDSDRRIAYNNYTKWKYGKLGSVRVPLPACVVWVIRDHFPDPYGRYTGFASSRYEKKSKIFS